MPTQYLKSVPNDQYEWRDHSISRDTPYRQCYIGIKRFQSITRLEAPVAGKVYTIVGKRLRFYERWVAADVYIFREEKQIIPLSFWSWRVHRFGRWFVIRIKRTGYVWGIIKKPSEGSIISKDYWR